MVRTLNMFQNYLDKDYDFNRKIHILNSKRISIIPVYTIIKKQYLYNLDYFNTRLVLKINNLRKIMRNFPIITALFLNKYIIYIKEGKKNKIWFDENLNMILYEEKENQDCKIMVDDLNGKVEYYNGEKDNEYKEMVIYSNNTKEFYEGQKDQEYLVKVEYPDVKTEFYEGQKGKEHLVKIEYPNLCTKFYEGQKGHEYLVKEKYPNLVTMFYEGQKGHEYLVKEEYPNLATKFYEGQKGEEHLVKIEYSDVKTEFYEGLKGQEYKVRDECGNHTTFYEGEKGKERIIRKENSDGNILFYDGEMGFEHIVRLKFNDGNILFYEGKKDQEHLVKIEYTTGLVKFYEGEKDLEHKIRDENDGEKSFFKGKKNNEYLVRIEKRDGSIEFYQGDKNQERKVLLITPEKDKIYYIGNKDEEIISEIKYQNGIHEIYGLYLVDNFKVDNFKVESCLNIVNYPDGTIKFYDGSKNKEYLTKIIYKCGKTESYTGVKGLESINQIYSNKTIYKYRGTKGNERLVNKILENGTEEFFKGLKDQEYKVKTKLPNNEIHYFLGYKDEEILTKIIYPDGEEKIFNSKSKDIKEDNKLNITNQHVEYIPPEIPKYSPEVKKELDRKRFERRNGLYSDQDKVNSIDSSFITQGHNKKLNPREKYSSNDQYKRKSLFLIQKEENVEECPCPTCSSVITRVHNNNHLKCLNCRTQFCFLCKTILINHLEKNSRKPHFGSCYKCPQHGNLVNVDN